MSKTRKILTSTFLIIGVVFLLVGCVMGTVYERRTENMVPVTGRILTFRQHWPVVTFTYGGRAYTVDIQQRDNGMKLGDEFPLMVNPENPYEFMPETLVILMWVFVALGIVFTLTGGVIFVVMSRSEQRRALLVSCGRRVSGTVVEVAENRSVTVNNRHPRYMKVRCEHPLTGETVTVRSHSLWGRVPKAGAQVGVCFDPMDEKRYAVDWSDEEAEP